MIRLWLRRLSTIVLVAAFVAALFVVSFAQFAPEQFGWAFFGLRRVASREVVKFPNGAAVTVPLGLEGIEAKNDPRYGSSFADTAILLSFSLPTTNTQQGNFVDRFFVDLGASPRANEGWEAIDARIRAQSPKPGLYPRGHAIFPAESGWSASVTTYYTAYRNLAPTLNARINLTREGFAPLRIHVEYREISTEPSMPPEPRATYARVVRQLALRLP